MTENEYNIPVTVSETPQTPEAAAAPEPPVSADPLGVALADAAKWKDMALRSQAEMENYRKRVARDREDDAKRTRAGILEDLLPVVDNFEMGMLEVRKADPKSPIVVGMEMIERQLRDFLAGAGVEAVPGVGAKFDPNIHEAVAQEASSTIAEGHIVRQMRKGYKLRDRLLRAATVVVSKGRGE